MKWLSVDSEGQGSFSCNKTIGCLIALNVSVFFLLVGIDTFGDKALGLRLFEKLALYPDVTIVLSRPWSVVTYMFTQGNVFHLLVNMAWLYIFGNISAIFTSPRIIAMVYLLGGVFSALIFLFCCQLFPSDSLSPIAGSSAAVMATVGASISIAPNFKFRLNNIALRLKWVGCIAAIVLLLPTRMNASDVSIIHLSGFLFGIAMGYIWKKRTLDRADDYIL